MGALRRLPPASVRMRFVLVVTVFLALAAYIQTEGSITADDMSKLTKEQLIAELQKSQTVAARQKTQLAKVTKEMHVLQYGVQLTPAQEKKRRAHEKGVKAQKKAEEMKKRAARMKKKEKLEDILMDHGAKYLAFIAAKQNQNTGSAEQHKAVMKAAIKGGRAGAVGPLRKVAHNVAVQAVKAARAAAKKAGKNYKKHKMRRISMLAAKKAVKKMFAEQDALVVKVSKKWTEKAIAKYPPAIQLAKHHNKPNHFTAPPTIHLFQVLGEDEVVPEN